MNESKSKEKSTGSKVSMIGPLAGLVAAIITVFSNLPAVLQYIMVLLLAMITVVSVYVVFGQQFIGFFKRTTMAVKHHFLTKKYFTEFNSFVDRLAELLKENRCDNIPYVFIHLQEMPPEFNNPRSLMYDVGGLLAVFKEGIKKVYRKDFRLLIKWFESILRVYNRQLVLQPFRQIRNFYRDKLTERDKEGYETSRENYVRFLQDYENFAKAINNDYGKNVAQDYFDKPGKL